MDNRKQHQGLRERQRQAPKIGQCREKREVPASWLHKTERCREKQVGRVSWLRSITLDFMSRSLFFQRLSQEKIPSQGIRKAIRRLAMGRRLRQILRSF